MSSLYEYSSYSPSLGVGAVISLVVCLLIGIWQLVCLSLIFKKTGIAGWKAFIPIYNVILIFDIVGINSWIAVIMVVPCINLIFLVFWFIAMFKLAKCFGGGTALGILNIFVPIVSFSILALSSKYQYEGIV